MREAAQTAGVIAKDMDEIVLRSLAKWPNVPAVFGWLQLDRRGRWLIQGDAVANPVIAAFIARNYEADEQGRWFFQNGPQRVFVDLAYTPLVYRARSRDAGPLELNTHTERPVGSVEGSWIDDSGSLLLLTPHGIGVVHDRDLPVLSQFMFTSAGEPVEEIQTEPGESVHQSGLQLRFGTQSVGLGFIRSSEVARTFGFDPVPRPPPGHPEC